MALTLLRSITNPSVPITDAVDTDRPFTFIEWVRNLTSDVQEELLFTEYKNYQSYWGIVKNRQQDEVIDLVRESYITLLKDLAINYTTASEKHLLNRLDWNDNLQILSVIPLFSKKLKEIALYYQRKRQEVKSSVAIKGLSLESIIVQRIIDAVKSSSDTEISRLSEVFSTDLQVTVDDLVNLTDNYQDKLTVTNYAVPSLDELDPAQTFVSTIIQESMKYPYFMTEIGRGLIINYSNNGDISSLKTRDYVDYVNTGSPDDLSVLIRSKLVSKLVGVDTNYQTSATSGTLVRSSSNMFELEPLIRLKDDVSEAKPVSQLGFLAPGKTTLVRAGGKFKVEGQPVSSTVTFLDTDKIETSEAPVTFVHDNSSFRRGIESAGAAGTPIVGRSTLTTHGYVSKLQTSQRSSWLDGLSARGYIADYKSDIFGNEYVKLSPSASDYTWVGLTTAPVVDSTIVRVLNGFRFRDIYAPGGITNYVTTGEWVEPFTGISYQRSGLMLNTNPNHTPIVTQPDFGPQYTSGESIDFAYDNSYLYLWSGDFTTPVFQYDVRTICTSSINGGPFIAYDLNGRITEPAVTTMSTQWPDLTAHYPYNLVIACSLNSVEYNRFASWEYPAHFTEILPVSSGLIADLYGGAFTDDLVSAPACPVRFGKDKSIRASSYVDVTLSGAKTMVDTAPVVSADMVDAKMIPGQYYIHSSTAGVISLHDVIQTPYALSSTSLNVYDNVIILESLDGVQAVDIDDDLSVTSLMTYSNSLSSKVASPLYLPSINKTLIFSLGIDATEKFVSIKGVTHDGGTVLFDGISYFTNSIDLTSVVFGKTKIVFNELRCEYALVSELVNGQNKYIMIVLMSTATRSPISTLTVRDIGIIQLQ